MDRAVSVKCMVIACNCPRLRLLLNRAPVVGTAARHPPCCRHMGGLAPSGARRRFCQGRRRWGDGSRCASTADDFTEPGDPEARHGHPHSATVVVLTAPPSSSS
ncbi:Os02g0760700 [Oryza sativa Japonica Group]|uniref:Os02g0760700 protein n=1 Tax=Oryza sativa subsp. japonica TaxID=39947 RepID=Q0DXD2_ORYSJ|nr:Os02g0760700 [Oryza sativa Japonica Group]|eukprot:NP_001048192.2 Os02g0760700 [Oryza sativa Japonica Group]